MSNTSKGLAYVIAGCILWGASGTVAEHLFTVTNIPPLSLVSVRLFFAGLLLLLICVILGKNIFSVFKSKNSLIMLFAFSIFGMLPSQLSYFMAINYSNAPTATILQFLGPVFIIIYTAFKTLKMPTRIDTISVIVAMTGTILLVTNGNLMTLSISPKGVFWGLMAGLASACYTLIPIQLMKEFDVEIIVGWGMLIGSVPLLPQMKSFGFGEHSLSTLVSVIFIVIFGTLCAYLFYLKSVKYLKPSTSSMLSSIEPLTATLLSVTLLGTHITTNMLIAMLLILSTIFLQTYASKHSISN